MENFYLDNDDILFHMKHMDLGRIIELREDGFAEKDLYPHAPVDAEDAKDSYERILTLVGEIAAKYLAPYAAEVDEEGVSLVNGEVRYAKATARALEIMGKADLMGFTLPRKYGGLNCPAIMLCIAAEMVSRGDGSFLNFGLQQDIGETLNKFGSEEQKARVLPLLSNGLAGSSMILTEPDAGSDLQSVMLRATQDPDGTWRLNGVKRFITNGCGRFGLVLVRSEEGRSGAGGLSFFLYDRKDGNMTIRRLEHKLGIHGSPTCELQFNNAPAELIAERRRGLTKYTIWLMNSARLGVAAQAVGIAEAAYREAYKYASERIQFGTIVKAFPPVFEMLTEMKTAIEAGRTLLYETARFVDLKEGLEHMMEAHPEKSAELKSDQKKFTRFSSLLTPMVKAYASETANRVANDAIQIHGGTGYMKEFNAERHFRDARITNIYEGTTQLQVVAAVGGITSGTASLLFDEYELEDFAHAEELFRTVKRARNNFEKAVVHVKGLENEELTSYHARRLVEMATDLVQSYLLLRDAKHSGRKLRVAEIFIAKMTVRIEMNMNFIMSGNAVLLENYRAVIEEKESIREVQPV